MQQLEPSSHENHIRMDIAEQSSVTTRQLWRACQSKDEYLLVECGMLATAHRLGRYSSNDIELEARSLELTEPHYTTVRDGKEALAKDTQRLHVLNQHYHRLYSGSTLGGTLDECREPSLRVRSDEVRTDTIANPMQMGHMNIGSHLENPRASPLNLKPPPPDASASSPLTDCTSPEPATHIEHLHISTESTEITGGNEPPNPIRLGRQQRLPHCQNSESYRGPVGSDVLITGDRGRTGEWKKAVQRSVMELDGVAPMGDRAMASVLERPPSAVVQWAVHDQNGMKHCQAR
ncbi:hypothetical protein CNYM01_05642 [Colletotrichum nymphaeae SA-01]|uniref:Uncharacterized protein n=1 Tax=Colletotrichum nymphaeae SA-01 TaxID=1460502 RepID=A0A135ULE4_9PEZI|nr:hypothetical protein CNYM01_05642 [Colletotrichum nymphaeae SA-01]